jgi:DNA-binding beta-propeller fold protein YncE
MKKVRNKEERIIKEPGIEKLLSIFIKKALFAVTFVSVLSVSSVIANAEVFLFKWGSFGSGDGQFDRPSGVAVDSLDNVYVADTHHNRVQKFTSDGTFITKWGSYGSGDGQFMNPFDVAVDSSDNVYVCCRSNK